MPIFDINAIPTFRKPTLLHRTKNISGQRFGKLFAISLLGMSLDSKHRATWLFICDCGNLYYSPVNDVFSGRIVSCGCSRDANRELWKSRFITHGMRQSKTYNIWCNMLYRCNNAHCIQFSDYGGRGISVCERWLKFGNFLADMGECPSNEHSIDRVNQNGNYEPENCCWADKWEQAANKRNNHNITIGDETYHLAEWSRRRSINRFKIMGRFKLGWTPEEALEFVPRRVPTNSKNR